MSGYVDCPCCGEVIMGDDKGVCSRRKIIARMDATELLRFYARMQAVKVLEYWDTEPPDVVLDWLATQRNVTGTQIQDWLANNGVQVRTVMLGEEGPEYKRLDAELRSIDEEIFKLRKAAVNILPMSRGVLPLDEIRAARRRVVPDQ